MAKVYFAFFLSLLSHPVLGEAVFSDGTSYGWGQKSSPESSETFWSGAGIETYGGSRLDDAIQAIRASQTQSDIISITSAAKIAAEGHIQKRQQEVRNAIYTSQGIDSLELIVKNDEIEDRQLYAGAGRQYEGPTDESMVNIQRLENAKMNAEQLVQQQIQSDKEIITIRMKLVQLEMTAQQRLSEVKAF